MFYVFFAWQKILLWDFELDCRCCYDLHHNENTIIKIALVSPRMTFFIIRFRRSRVLLLFSYTNISPQTRTDAHRTLDSDRGSWSSSKPESHFATQNTLLQSWTVLEAAYSDSLHGDKKWITDLKYPYLSTTRLNFDVQKSILNFLFISFY